VLDDGWFGKRYHRIVPGIIRQHGFRTPRKRLVR
jgi:hypothetical protein